MKKQLSLCVMSTMLASTPTAAQTDSAEYKQYHFRGEGEMIFQRMDYGADRYGDPVGALCESRAYSSILSTTFALDHKLRDDVVLTTEVALEYGITGTAMGLEYDEAGEGEMEWEKGGEVVLEQFHITKCFAPWLNVRIGHFIVPVGLTNAHYDPIFFCGTTPPEGEMTILPCTWHETGLSILGEYRDLKYEVMLVNGLDPNGFSSSNWIQGGKQGLFETAVMSSPALAGRVEYTPIKGLQLGFSGYYNKSAKNASVSEKAVDIDAAVSIGTFDLQYQNKNAVVRANVVYGHLTDALRISQINRNISKSTQFARTPVAEEALAYSVEAGYNVLSFFNSKQKLMPFARYEYYNSAEKAPKGMADMPINKRSILTVGANYALLRNLLIKADYSIHKPNNDRSNSEHTFGIAMAYTGSFSQK